ncbi:MAG TPA: acyl-CoA dehydrogenase family protein, partial [Actinomycetes bacterium]
MDFAPSPRAAEMLDRLQSFMDDLVLPAEPVYAQQRRANTAAGRPHDLPQVVEDLKSEARGRGLWNLFLPAESGLSVTEYAPLAELTGWSPDLAPEALNCAAPDTGNMEVLHLVGTDEQQRRWLDPLLAGEIRSAFAMTEPDVASSDARNIRTAIRPDGDEYVVSGRKWWATGAADPRCAVLVVMGRTDPDAEPYRQQSMVLVPMDAPGVRLVRSVPVFGYHDQHGHGEIVLDDVRVPR